MSVTGKSSINGKPKSETALCSEKPLGINSVLEEFPSLSSLWGIFVCKENPVQ